MATEVRIVGPWAPHQQGALLKDEPNLIIFLFKGCMDRVRDWRQRGAPDAEWNRMLHDDLTFVIIHLNKFDDLTPAQAEELRILSREIGSPTPDVSVIREHSAFLQGPGYLPH